ncbi:MAG TPA: hypothetical protein VLL97_11890 [Acidobacteriota bacterium]|nr:hypothetical protein [Acidobacteriota bacterium]
MAKSYILGRAITGMLVCGLFFAGAVPAQKMSTITSDNVIVMIPPKWELLGRELMPDIQRCFVFMNRSIKNRLPSKVSILVDWKRSESRSDHLENSIIIGMNNPAATANERAFLFHEIARELARMGLLRLSNGAQREDTKFLFEGMIEVLVHEFDHSSRRLEAAWATARLLDEMQLLGFEHQRSWSGFSGGRRSHRNAAPGVTFIKMHRDLQGRDRPMELFESLRKSGFIRSLSNAFRAPAAELEENWLRRVREYRIPDEIVINADEVPRLRKTELVPERGNPGESIQIRLYIESGMGSLPAEMIFIRDERTGRIVHPRPASEMETSLYTADIPIDEECPPGSYVYTVTAINEGGNLKRWSGYYHVGGDGR